MATVSRSGSQANAADEAIAFARSQKGKPYRWGATGPDAYDCSGLIQTSYAHAGVRLTRTTYTQVREGVPVTRAGLLPGDLIFPNPGHVQLYVGGGKVIEAPQDGIPVREVPIWGFWKARRVTTPGTGSAIATSPAAGAPAASTDAAGFAVPGLPSFSLPGVDALEWIVKPHNWLRIAEFTGGAVVIMVAVKTVGS